MSFKSAPPPGTADIFPAEVASWYRLESAARKVFSLYGYGELRTPVFEYTEVFKRGLCDDTEVVQKEMYTFEDRGGRSLTLRPEGTAGVMRAMLNTEVMNGIEQRVFYSGPMFRGERPAAGRRRQFHQIGVENVGRMAPELDAECIAMLMHFLEECQISGSKLMINTRGAIADRKPAEDALKQYFTPFISSMCDDCKSRLERNVWRILDCKQEQCQNPIKNAPDVVNFFSEESKNYFKRVCETLRNAGVEFTVEPRLVRGLDYYVHTVFEISHSGLGAQNAIAGGGRYELYLPDNNKPVIGVGFAAGMERLLMVQEALKVSPPEDPFKVPVYLISLGQAARDFNMKFANELRKSGIPVIAEVEDKSMKAQMRTANRINAKFVLICGDSELQQNILVCKDMSSGEQSNLSPGDAMTFLKGKI